MRLLLQIAVLALACPWAVAAGIGTPSASLRSIMYLTGQHPVIPDQTRMKGVSHVIMAFMPSTIFLEDSRTSWPLFMTVDRLRQLSHNDIRVMIAIGGWGDTAGFSTAALDATSRERFAHNVARMLRATGADGVDIDWEYPGGNGEDYKQVPNAAKVWEIEAYPLLMAELRSALGPRVLLSAAVPGRPEDMLAFTRITVPRILNHVDFLNVMTYDLMNRRDNVTLHHTGVQQSLVGLNAYVKAGAAPQKLNLGFAFYAKWAKTEHDRCLGSPIGCPTLLLEDPSTGADLGRIGGFSWHDDVPKDLKISFDKAIASGIYDDPEGGYYYWDEVEDLWWTFDTADTISGKFPRIVENIRVGGVFAWGLGEDAPAFEHLEAVLNGLARMQSINSRVEL